MSEAISAEQFRKQYSQVFDANERWNQLPTPKGVLYEWDENSTYIQEPPFFVDMSVEAERNRSDSRRQCSRSVGRFRHHGPYFAGRKHRPQQPGREISPRTWRQSKRLQLLWFPSRKRPGHDTRNLCKHPDPEPNGTRF